MSLLTYFSSLPQQLKLLVCLAGVVLLAIPVLYLMFVTLPVGLTAIASGRGVTAWGLEISPNKACEHAQEILANSTVNNEVALYGTLAKDLLASSDTILLSLGKENDAQRSELIAQSNRIFAQMNEAQQAQAAIANGRLAMFNAINDGCLKRVAGNQATISWQVTFLVLGYMLLLVWFANTLVKFLFKPSAV